MNPSDLEFSELVATLPNIGECAPRVSSAPAGTHLPEREIGEVYIPAQLAVAHAAPDNKPAILLIAAGAGVGKSTMARELARTSGNPYWDLGKFRMGSGFYVGTLVEIYGPLAYARIYDQILTGRLTLILDAADEAVVGSTSANFNAALDNLADIAANASREAPIAVIFGRPDTITDIWTQLTDRNLETTVLDVRFFGESEATEFVRQRAAALTGTPLLKELDDFLEYFKSRVMEASRASMWREVQEFLGYAPVLESLATFYATEDNPYGRLRGYNAARETQTWDLLATMLHGVLEREQDKFEGNFGAGDIRRSAYARRSYTPDVQVRLLLAEDPGGLELGAEIMSEEELDWQADLEGAAMAQFSQHPFLKSLSGDHRRNPLLGFQSPAFRDYVLAVAVGLLDHGQVEHIWRRWNSHEVTPSMMLSRFCYGEDYNRPLPLHALPLLIESHSSQASSRGAIGQVAKRWLLSIEPMDVEPDSVQGIAVQFDVPSGGSPRVIEVNWDGRSPVPAGRLLNSAVIVLPDAELVLGEGAERATIGPGAAISVQSFGVHARDLTVLGTDMSESSLVIAERLDGHIMSISSPAPGHLIIVAPRAPHPWSRHIWDGKLEPAPNRTVLASLGVQFRSFLSRFERGQRMFSIHSMQTLVNKGRVDRQMIRFCESEGIIWRDGDVYRYAPPIAFDTIRRIDLDDRELHSLLERYHACRSQ